MFQIFYRPLTWLYIHTWHFFLKCHAIVFSQNFNLIGYFQSGHLKAAVGLATLKKVAFKVAMWFAAFKRVVFKATIWLASSKKVYSKLPCDWLLSELLCDGLERLKGIGLVINERLTFLNEIETGNNVEFDKPLERGDNVEFNKPRQRIKQPARQKEKQLKQMREKANSRKCNFVYFFIYGMIVLFIVECIKFLLSLWIIHELLIIIGGTFFMNWLQKAWRY